MNVCPVLVGRRAELEELERALRQGGLVLVSGEAGIGKTRLVRELAARAADRGRAVVWARPEALTTPGPYSLVADLLEDLAQISDGGGAEARELASTLGGSVSAGAEPPARQIAARIRGLLAELRKPPVVAIEDLHAADEMSHAVLAHLGRSAADDGMLLVATYRPEEAQRAPMTRLLDLLTRDRIAAEVSLAPLGDDDVAGMLRAMWEDEPSGDELAAILKLGEGVPFFVEELAAARAAGEPRVPATIARAVLARLGGLDADGQAVMRAASLASGAADPAVLALATGVAEAEIPRHLLSGVSAGLLADREGRLVFRHALVREAIAGSIVSVEARDLHRRLADAIERFHAPEAEAHAAELARHRREAGQAPEAARWSVAAGRRALAAGALDEARAAFGAALDAGEPTRWDARAGLAEVHIRMREFDEARALHREATDGYRIAGMVREAAQSLIRIGFTQQADTDRAALTTLDEALAIVEGTENEDLRARALIDKGFAQGQQFNEWESSVPALVAGAEIAERLEDAALLADAYNGLAWVEEHRGNVAEANRRGEAACIFAIRSASDERVGKTHTGQALRLAIQGRCTEGLRYIEEGRRYLIQGLGSLYVASIDQITAWVYWRMGMPAEAERYASRLTATRYAQQYALVIRAWAALERGQREEARALVDHWWEQIGERARERAFAAPDETDTWEPATFALLAELIVRVRPEGPIDDESLALARRYLVLAEEGGDSAVVACLLHARATMRAGLLEEAEGSLEIVDRELAKHQIPLRAAEALELRAEIAARRGAVADAGAIFGRAADGYELCENAASRARAIRRLAECHVHAGADNGSLGDRLRVAREIALVSGATAEINRVESLMRTVGVRPRAGRPRGRPRLPEGTLSAREEEIVSLVAGGASNAEVAGRLYLSERTIEDHLRKAQRRLGVSGRAALAAWAAKQGLV